MEFYDVIRNRRSCRKFSPDPIPKKVLERVVEAATWAPSGKNRQNWRIFVVIGQGRDQLAQVADRSFPLLEPSLRRLYDDRIVSFTKGFFKTLGGAPVVMVFYSDATEEGEFVDTQSVAAAVQNALLAATYEGLGTCWMTNPVHLKEEVDQVTGAGDLDLVAMVPVGFPAKEPPVPPRKEGRIRWIGF